MEVGLWTTLWQWCCISIIKDNIWVEARRVCI